MRGHEGVCTEPEDRRLPPGDTVYESRELGAGAYKVTWQTPACRPLASKVAFTVISLRRTCQVMANKRLNVNAAEHNDLIYNQIIRLSINASAVISLPGPPGHFSSTK